jgi:SpoIID/LytB domain protein
MRWRLIAGVFLVAALAPAPSARAAVPVLVIDGKGWGHGVGMAQDGAFWMGAAGQSANQILGHFYPGTSIARSGGTIQVAVLDVPTRDTIVSFPNGGDVGDAQSGQQSAGFPVHAGPGGSVRVWFDGAYHAQAVGGGARASASGASVTRPDFRLVSHSSSASVRPQVPSTTIPSATTTTMPIFTTTTKPLLTTTTTKPSGPPPTSPPPPAPPPQTVATSGRALWALPANGSVTALPARGRQYRGVMSISNTGPLHFVNHIDVEQYLRGMGEVRDPSWPQASLKTQAIAARTYALRSQGSELCDYDRCQVYLGVTAEYGAMDRAVSDSRGQVVTFGGALASTVYSANAGGFSATAAEGFGAGSANYPYLKAAPYTTNDPDPWTVRIGLSDLAARFGSAGPLQGVHVAQAGPSGRALSVSLDGANGPTLVDAHQFASGLGLKSTLFGVRIDQEAVAPAPPAPAELIQVPPDQLAAADPLPLPPDLTPVPQGPVKLIIPATGHGRLRWIALALMLIPAWALASTYAGYGMVPVEVRRWMGARFSRFLPGAPPAPPT